MAEDVAKPSRRFPRAGWIAIGPIVLALASPLLVELWRQYDIGQARDDYRGAMEDASVSYAHVGDWDGWYRANVPDGPGQQAFVRLGSDALVLDDNYKLVMEGTDLLEFLESGDAPDPAVFSEARVDAYLRDSEAISNEAARLLQFSHLYGPPANEVTGNGRPVIAPSCVFSALEDRAMFLYWRGRAGKAFGEVVVGLELLERLRPFSTVQDIWIALGARERLLAIAAKLLCAHAGPDAPVDKLDRLMADWSIDELHLLDLELQSLAQVAKAPDEYLTAQVALFDWPGSLGWFGWASRTRPDLAARGEAFRSAGDHFRNMAKDAIRTQSNFDALRRGAVVPFSEACWTLQGGRRRLMVSNLHARRARAALVLRRQAYAGATPGLDSKDFPVVRLRDIGGRLELRLEPDAALLDSIEVDHDFFHGEFDPILFRLKAS